MGFAGGCLCTSFVQLTFEGVVNSLSNLNILALQNSICIIPLSEFSLLKMAFSFFFF